MIAFRVDERVGAGFQADDTFKCFLTKFLEGCKDGGQCEDHDHWAELKMLVMCCCSVDARLKVDANVLSLGSGLCRWCVRFGLIFILNCSGQSFSARKTPRNSVLFSQRGNCSRQVFRCKTNTSNLFFNVHPTITQKPEKSPQRLSR